MGIPTLQGLQTALSGLTASQEALDVIGENVTNEETPGYVRETAVLETNPPLTIASISATTGKGADIGTGVSVGSIERVANAYLESEYRNESTSLASASTTTEMLEQVQNALGNSSESGLSTELSAFWSAWNDLADSPTSAAASEEVVTAGVELADTINELAAQIENVTKEAGERYETLMGEGGEVHTDAEEIAELNGQIKLAEQGGLQPNELIDRRELLVDELSKVADVSVSEGAYGVVTVSFGGSETPLVEGDKVNWPTTLSANPGGELGALKELSGAEGKLASLGRQLDEVAEALTSSVNALQPEAAFFTYTSGEAAATLTVSATAETIQAGAGGEGANGYAMAIAELRGGEAEQLYETFVASVGREVQTSQAREANAEAMLDAISSQRDSVSGVSLDEEMTDMIAFQRGYEASARVMTTMDATLETLIEHTGTVGL